MIKDSTQGSIVLDQDVGNHSLCDVLRSYIFSE